MGIWRHEACCQRRMHSRHLIVSALLLGCAPHPAATPAQHESGDLFQIVNHSGAGLAFRNAGPHTMSEPFLAPDRGILVDPSSVKDCIFSDGKKTWRYD